MQDETPKDIEQTPADVEVKKPTAEEIVEKHLPAFMTARGFRHPETPVDANTKTDAMLAIDMPMERIAVEDLQQLSRDFTNYARQLDKDASDKEISKAFMETLSRIYGKVWSTDTYHKFFDREGADIQQTVDGDSGILRTRSSSVGIGEKALSGRNVLLALESVFGLGRPTTTYLYASGLVLTIGNIRKSDYSSLQAQMAELGSEAGRGLRGRLFVGDNCPLTSLLVDFILEHVITCNVSEWSSGAAGTALLKQLLLVTDITPLLAAALHSLHPTGYPLRRYCKNTLIGKCDYTNTTKLKKNNIEYEADTLAHFDKITWTDRTRLNKKQIRHMEARERTTDQIREYQQDYFDSLENTHIDIDGDKYTVRVVGRVPTFLEYAEMGSRWDAEVNHQVDQLLSTFTGSDRDRRNRRAQHINHFRKILRAQSDASWVKNIQFISPEGEHLTTVDDPDDVFESLSLFSEEEDLYNRFISEMVKFQEGAFLTQAGIMNFRCPKCGTAREGDELKHNLIPVNLVSLFFTTAITEWTIVNTI